ncbi:RNA polymerase sigma factor [Paenarthrobacter nitroguajacolicus]|uniref:RNA polymerase sigma factor n=1 Tax=Paenarthrobacter nitroguajacolicus TaxID=211146 RepID=UPI0006D2C69C
MYEPQAPYESDGEVHRALSLLRLKDRELVMLIVWDGFGVAEAGAILGLSATASRTRYSRARKQLKDTLERSPESKE